MSDLTLTLLTSWLRTVFSGNKKQCDRLEPCSHNFRLPLPARSRRPFHSSVAACAVTPPCGNESSQRGAEQQNWVHQPHQAVRMGTGPMLDPQSHQKQNCRENGGHRRHARRSRTGNEKYRDDRQLTAPEEGKIWKEKCVMGCKHE